VRPFEVVEEAYKHAYRGVYLLGFAGFVQDGYRVSEALYSHLLDVDIPLVF
jgi:hypothetical protein